MKRIVLIALAAVAKRISTDEWMNRMVRLSFPCRPSVFQNFQGDVFYHVCVDDKNFVHGESPWIS